MPQHLHLDFETFSLADIKAVGAYRYAFDPSTEILCAAMALGDDEPFVWGSDAADDVCAPFLDALEDPEVLIYAHNAMFESAICQALIEKTWGIPCPDIRRFRCTMSLARRAALPGSLDQLGEVLGLPVQKDKTGKSLMKKFSMLQPYKKATKTKPEVLPRRIRPEDDPEAFSNFMAYCAQDVRVEQAAAKKLAYFDEPINNANYQLDQVINARGVPVNLDALRHAQTLIEEETEIISQKFRELTGFEVTQGAKILAWANEQGCNLPNLQAETIDSFLEAEEDNDELVVRCLQLRQSISYAAVKKVATMIACAGPHDNRIRGMLNHHGATTGRWTASLVQFQNMKRPSDAFLAETYKDSGVTWSEVAYKEICNGVSREMLELCHGPVLEVISSCIRHFVEDV